jgi:hypothetical protein
LSKLLIDLLPTVALAMVIPFLTIVAWLLLKKLGGLGFSSGLDLVGGKMALDLSIAVAPAQWLLVIKPSFWSIFPLAFGILTLLSLIAGVVLIFIERKFARFSAGQELRSVGQNVPPTLEVRSPWGWFILGWLITTSIWLLNAVVFLVGVRVTLQ